MEDDKGGRGCEDDPQITTQNSYSHAPCNKKGVAPSCYPHTPNRGCIMRRRGERIIGGGSKKELVAYGSLVLSYL